MISRKGDRRSKFHWSDWHVTSTLRGWVGRGKGKWENERGKKGPNRPFPWHNMVWIRQNLRVHYTCESSSYVVSVALVNNGSGFEITHT